MFQVVLSEINRCEHKTDTSFTEGEKGKKKNPRARICQPTPTYTDKLRRGEGAGESRTTCVEGEGAASTLNAFG